MGTADRVVKRRPLTAESLRNTILAIEAFHMTPNRPYIDVSHVAPSFHAPTGSVIEALDVLAKQGAIAWRTQPEEAAAARVGGTIWDLHIAAVKETWAQFALPPLSPDANRNEWRFSKLFYRDVEDHVAYLALTPAEAPGNWLTFSLVDAPDLSDQKAPLAHAIPWVGYNEVYYALELAPEGRMTCDELASWFGLVGDEQNQLAGLLTRWAKEGSLSAEGKKGKERYRTDPGPLPTNAASLYLELWPMPDFRNEKPNRAPIGKREAHRRTGLALGTVSEHFDLLEAAGLLKQNEDEKYEPARPHAILAMARSLARISATAKGAPLTIRDILDALAQPVHDEPWHKLGEGTCQLTFLAAAREAGYIVIDNPRGKSLRDQTLGVTMHRDAWMILRACKACGGPWNSGPLHLYEEQRENERPGWGRITHVTCPPMNEWIWDEASGEHDRYRRSEHYHAFRCTTCEGVLWRATPEDLEPVRKQGGHARIALDHVQRIHLIVKGAGAMLPPTAPKDRPRDILNQLRSARLEWKKQLALLARLDHALRSMDLAIATERAAWGDALLDIERLYFRRQEAILLDDVPLVRPPHEHESMEEFRSGPRRSAEERAREDLDEDIRELIRDATRHMRDDPAVGVPTAHGFAHPACATSE